jgi:hypothetical protein
MQGNVKAVTLIITSSPDRPEDAETAQLKAQLYRFVNTLTHIIVKIYSPQVHTLPYLLP